MTQDERQYNIHPKWRLPREDISCPECGQVYGHHKTMVETSTELCSACVRKIGAGGKFISAEEFIAKLKERI